MIREDTGYDADMSTAEFVENVNPVKTVSRMVRLNSMVICQSVFYKSEFLKCAVLNLLLCNFIVQGSNLQ